MSSLRDEDKLPALFVANKKVDPRTRTRTVPMRILHLSMPRTGTASMEAALKILGSGPVCHGFNMWMHVQDVNMWGELMRTIFSSNPSSEPSYGWKEFDNLLGDYELVSDFPPLAFAPEPIAAYPEAKVILVE
ncbi:hypothetical protein B0O99DRAFT_194904 [Bisporella sp. PMI_857]|nr:hypothetical protein B0O99DRAFT_194904 [Bisporella sp. PMI_857]